MSAHPTTAEEPSELERYTCLECDKTFAHRTNRNRHMRSAHRETKKHKCNNCSKTFARLDKFREHSRKCLSSYECLDCGQTFAQLLHFNRHRATVHRPQKPKQSRPAPQPKPVPQPKTLPQPSSSTNVDAALSTHNEDPVEFRAGELLGEETAEMLEIYERHWDSIRTHHVYGRPVQDIFNYRMSDTVGKEVEIVNTVFIPQQLRFKINCSYGYVLRNNENGDLRYFHPSQNNAGILQKPKLVSDEGDFWDFLDAITREDILEWARLQRPNSKWVVHRITNITFYVNKIANHPIGGVPEVIPDYILGNKFIYTLVKDAHNQFIYNDNLCLFRCLALWSGADRYSLNRITKALFQKFTDVSKQNFAGVKLEELPNVERMFQVNIKVFELVEEDDAVVAKIVKRSTEAFSETMYINLYKQHFSFITDINQYSKSFSCRKCGKLWTTAFNVNRHEKTCSDELSYCYEGGVFHNPPTIFEKLEEEDIVVPREERFYPFRAAYDFEAYFDKTNLPEPSDKRSWEARHVPLSVSVCSNVPDFETPRCFITNGNTQELIRDMMEYLGEISTTAYNHLRNHYADTIRELEEKIQKMKGIEPSTGESDTHPLESLLLEFDAYLMELPLLGFNSGKYDVNLVKKELLSYLLHHNPIKFNVKKNNSFMCIKTANMKFLDITNFLAPGYSYDKYLKAFGCSVTKGFLPYEFIDSLAKLDQDHLPEHQAFFSSLKNENISAEEYQYCQQVWTENNMTTFRDFLIWYNNRDVKPFLEAVEKQFRFYQDRDIDMFKDGISVPGLTMKYLFNTMDQTSYFTMCNEHNKDLYHLIKNNIVGGPSIVFDRYQEKGVTQIRKMDFGDNAKLCQSIIGFDANALYLWALMQKMPTGWYIRRRQENNFKIEYTSTYGRMAQQWLDYVAAKDGIQIRHQANGVEKRLGRRRLPVDGWCKSTQTVYQFHGCWWHGHKCGLNTDKNGQQLERNQIRDKSMAELYEETQNNSKYIKNLGYRLVEMWECQWKSLRKDIPEMRNQQRHKPRNMTMAGILDGVKKEEIFGLVECDITVPQRLRGHFQEMTPIFKNTDISRDDIGAHMRAYAETSETMKQPRRSLIGSYYGKKILLATPLLKWYLEHGLEVTHIFQTIEYEGKECFKSFGEQVSTARRAGDADPDKAILADSYKLLGNAAYGKTLTSKEKQRDVMYCDAADVSKYINDASFRTLNQLDDDIFEVERNKKRIKVNLPSHIGYFVYQYAKLRMLEFYYDFVDVFVDRKDFVMCEMDTDSSYMALSAPHFEDVIKPELRGQFYSVWDKWFPAEACDSHKKDFITTKLRKQEWRQTPCCEERKKFDKRTPGLFKEEFKGDGIISLCSKTYYCFGETNKLSCKGINKRQNKLDRQKYLDVLTEKKSGSGINRGFLIHNNSVYTYLQERSGLSYFYPKRQVQEDGCSTIPLEI